MNQERLREYINTLVGRPNNVAITITSLGNVMYIVKEINSFYCLLIPMKPIDKQKVRNLSDYGFVEKFEGINFHREFTREQVDEITQVVDLIFVKVLDVNKTRQWRFEINDGMVGLRINEPLLTAYQRRQRNFKEYDKLSYKMKTFIFSEFGIAFLMFVIGCFYLKYALPQISVFTAILFSAINFVVVYFIHKLQARYKRKNNR